MAEITPTTQSPARDSQPTRSPRSADPAAAGSSSQSFTGLLATTLAGPSETTGPGAQPTLPTGANPPAAANASQPNPPLVPVATPGATAAPTPDNASTVHPQSATTRNDRLDTSAKAARADAGRASAIAVPSPVLAGSVVPPTATDTVLNTPPTQPENSAPPNAATGAAGTPTAQSTAGAGATPVQAAVAQPTGAAVANGSVNPPIKAADRGKPVSKVGTPDNVRSNQTADLSTTSSRAPAASFLPAAAQANQAASSAEARAASSLAATGADMPGGQAQLSSTGSPAVKDGQPPIPLSATTKLASSPRADGLAAIPSHPSSSDTAIALKSVADASAADLNQVGPEPSSLNTAPFPVTHPDAVAISQAPSPHAAGAPQAASPRPPDPPATQIAQAITEPVKIVLASPPQQPGGAHILTIHLTPADLGRVEIRIERPTDGPAKIELAAERPDTLLRLIHDQPQLQQALDQAGIPQTGRIIQFNLSADNSSANSPGASLSGDGAQSGGGQRSQQGYAGNSSRNPEPFEPTPSYASWARAGLDITA